MTATVSRFASGMSGHVLVAIAGFAIGALVVWPALSGLLPASSTGEVAMLSCPVDGSRVGVIRAGDQVLVTGRTADGAWVEVQYGGPGLARAYVRAAALTIAGDVAALPVADCLAPPGAAGPGASLTAVLQVGPTDPPTEAPSESQPAATPTGTPVSGSPAPTATPTHRPTAVPTRGPTPKPPPEKPPPTKAPTAPPTAPPTATAAPTPPPPVAGFSWAPTNTGDPWYTVAFTDTSTGGATSWAWDFDGNGTIDSTSQTPSPWHYTSTGTKTARLTVANEGGSHAFTASVTIPSPTLTKFTATFTESNAEICLNVKSSSAVVQVKAWPGVSTVTLYLILPLPQNQTPVAYPMAHVGTTGYLWRKTVTKSMVGTVQGDLFFLIAGKGPNTFRDNYPDGYRKLLHVEPNCVD